MTRAIWNGTVVAESDSTVVVESSHYFPVDSIKREYFRRSRWRSLCPWKGIASYYHNEVDGQINRNAAWYYPHPTPLARMIRNRVAFWRGVEIQR